MKLYIDGDSLPKLLKEILYRGIHRFEINTWLISNKKVSIGQSDLINYLVVDEGFNEADNKIVEMVNEGDLVITSDIPLADRVIEKNAFVINHRGKLLTIDNVKQSLATRNLMTYLRDTGEITGGPNSFSKKDVHEFANQFDKFLTKYFKN